MSCSTESGAGGPRIGAALALCLALWLATLSGCRVLPERVEGKGWPLAQVSMPDVPVPEGFLFHEDRSYFWEGGGLRVARLVLEGSARGAEVLGWYRERMPLGRWELEHASGMTTGRLQFVKQRSELAGAVRGLGMEECVVSVTDAGWGSLLVVEVHPVASGPRETE